MFYNTIHQTGEQLKENWANATRQERAIWAVFNRLPADVVLTPFEVLNLSGLNVPITSIRRAMTDLTKAGILEKTPIMKSGPYGKPSHSWALKQHPAPQAYQFANA